MVSGGPFGLEELVSKAGYGPAMLVLILTPVLWSVPTALMVAELSAMIPAEGGYYVWVRRALGPFWGFQEAWLSLAASIFDMAIYPTLFVAYLQRIWPVAGRGHNGVLIGMALIVVCTLWNLRGASAVGNGSLWLGAALLTPFVLISLRAWTAGAGAFASAAHSTAATLGARDLLGGIMIAMWNYMGWDNATTIAGEVESPQRNYPRMLFAALALILVVYLVPVGGIWHAGVPLSAWDTGSWADMAGSFAGRWGELAMVIAGMVSAIGMFNALALSYSRVPYAMAEDGLLPRRFGRVHPSTGVPRLALVACAAMWMLSLGLSFSRLVMFDILLYGMSLVLEFAALIALRMREPEVRRPFRVPGGVLGAVLCGVLPTMLIVLAVVRNSHERLGKVNALVAGLVLIAAGPFVYWVTARWRARRPQ
jgi:amino acid transporter